MWPPLAPWRAMAGAWAWCWATEFFQLTGVPAAWSTHSLLSRLVLGVRFDPADLPWYPAGIAPLPLAHQMLRRRAGGQAGLP